MGKLTGHNDSGREGAVPSEMEIVDTFTHLIFGGDEELSERELAIVHTLCSVDRHAAECPACEIGSYLRDLGVKEMIGLVGRVRSHYPAPAQTGSRAARGQSARA